MKAKLVRMSGPGVKGLEHCPPYYRADLDADEWAMLTADPAKVLRELGAPADVADKATVKLVNPGQGWDSDANAWRQVMPGEPPKPKPWCVVCDTNGECSGHYHC